MMRLAATSMGCQRRVEVVSCEVDHLGMCHDGVVRSEAERRELKEAVCKKSDERYAERACRRDDLLGTCEFAKGRERPLR